MQRGGNGSKLRFLKIVRFRWHKPWLEMTKTELQTALATATQTDKKTAGVFLDTLSNLAYKAIKKDGEFVLPGFGSAAVVVPVGLCRMTWQDVMVW
jgi:hypothetical protein